MRIINAANWPNLASLSQKMSGIFNILCESVHCFRGSFLSDPRFCFSDFLLSVLHSDKAGAVKGS